MSDISIRATIPNNLTRFYDYRHAIISFTEVIHCSGYLMLLILNMVFQFGECIMEYSAK